VRLARHLAVLKSKVEKAVRSKSNIILSLKEENGPQLRRDYKKQIQSLL